MARFSLVPRTTEFYELFTRAGVNALEAARLAERRFREFPDTSVTQEEVKKLEVRGDELTHELIHLLNTQYVTPFDREDIYNLATAVDDIVDYIEEASDLLDLYKVESSMEQAIAQSTTLAAAVEHLAQGLAELRRGTAAQPHLAEVKRYEDEGDRIVRDAIAALFEDDGVSPREIIRWKDIFDGLERAIDACETAAHIATGVVVKNA